MKLQVVELGTGEFVVERQQASKWVPISTLYHPTAAEAKKELTQFVLRGPKFSKSVYEVESSEIKRPEPAPKRVRSKSRSAGSDAVVGSE